MTEELFSDPDALRQLSAQDRDGRPIGAVGQVYVDDWSGRPEWVTVRTADPAGGEIFVPLAGAAPGQDGVLRVACTAEAVRTAPPMHAEQHLGLEQEQELYLHYGLTPPTGEASGAPGVGADRPLAPVTGDERELQGIDELAAEESDVPAPRLRRFTATDPDSATAGSSGVRGEAR